jgi:hypothetical protein
LYALVDELLDLPRVSQPELKLVTVLARAALPTVHKTVSAAAISPPLVTQTLPKELEKAVTAPLQPAPQPVAAKAGSFDWPRVLAALKKHHPGLYSVLARAEVDYRPGQLQLTFAYALHRKKLEQPVYRQQLSAVLDDVCGINPDITVLQNAHDNKKNIKDDKAQTVAAIMGGGELIDAESTDG